MCNRKECSAFEELRKQLEKQCDKYHDLDISGDIGKAHYKLEHGKWVPKENIGEYLRGGVVSTMAVFEAFVRNLMIEAFNVIITECACARKSESGKTQQSCSSRLKDNKELFRKTLHNCSVSRNAFQKVLEREKSKEAAAAKAAELFFEESCPDLYDFLIEHRNRHIQMMTKPLIHDFDEAFKNVFGKEFSIGKAIFEVTETPQPIEYHYPLNDKCHSVIKISDGEGVCAILRLWYGIRCISAHGMAAQTIDPVSALHDFPWHKQECKKMKCDFEKNEHKCSSSKELKMLDSGRKLCTELKNIFCNEIPQEDSESISDPQYTVIESIPNIQKIKGLDQKTACDLIHELGMSESDSEYPAGNGYYHISRIAYFAVNL